MPEKKSIKKEKISKRGKGDVKQSVKVSVRIGETKQKRKRQYRRKPKGESDLARIGETATLYRNLPPPPPTQYIQTPQLPPAFQEQPKIAGLLEDVKRERQNLLTDISTSVEKAINERIAKSQGAEQRAELLRLGWTEPVSKPPSIQESIQTTAPSFSNLAGKESQPSQPIITEVKQGRGRPKGKKNKPKMAVEAVDETGITYGLAKQVKVPKGSKIPVPDLEKMPISSLRAETYNV